MLNRVVLGPVERIVVVAALCAGVVIVSLIVAGFQLGQTQRDGSRPERLEGAVVSAGPESPRGPGETARGSAFAMPTDSPPGSQQRGLTAVAALPDWVQALRATHLWTDPTGPNQTASMAQWQFLRVLGAAESRLRVELETEVGTPASGWVGIDDVGVSAAPPAWLRTIRATLLFSSQDRDEFITLVPLNTDLMIAGETAGRRTFVYLPTEATTERTGYGWIEQDAVEGARPPRGIALPSPSFRAVPLGKPGAYRIRPGDSIQILAARSGVSVSEIIRLNGLDAANQIVVGQVLQLPDRSAPTATNRDGPRLIRELSPGWVSAEYAVVVDDSSGQILWARDANTPVAPASLTKMMTTLVVLDHSRLSDVVSVRVDSQRMSGSTVMGLLPSEQVSVEDLLYGLMLPSGNDAALALAEHVAGTKESFAELMNTKARALGLSGSRFANPHGLDATGHLSTAFDMAMIARAGMQDTTFRALAGAKSYDSPTGNRYRFTNLNQLLWRYAGADGVKIGFTDAAGRAIVGSATRDGHRVYVAMMRSADIYADGAALLDWAFASYAWP